jgi:uncharacterized protein YjbI with pentapeptide repeats
MANKQHVDSLLESNVLSWNEWRKQEPTIRPDLSGIDLANKDLGGADLSNADLRNVDLRKAYLFSADPTGTDFIGADLSEANLISALLVGAHGQGAHLQGAYLNEAYLGAANLRAADLSGAHLHEAHLRKASFSGADLRGADLSGADLRDTDFSGADLSRADLTGSRCVGTNLSHATLAGCLVYGIAAWNVNLEDTTQIDLRITSVEEEANVTVDNLEVAQFLYLMLHNQKVRTRLDTITSKVVLILGRFSKERKPVLNVLRNALREHDYVPVLFDFTGPESKTTTDTVSLLARMARFVIADLTDPSSVPYELKEIVPDAHMPVQPLLLAGTESYASMARDLWISREMLPVYYYTSPQELLRDLPEHVIASAEAKVKELQYVRATAITRSGLP